MVEEASKRAEATLAAAKGELVLPKKKKGRWVKRLASSAPWVPSWWSWCRKFFGSKDADWQAARPSTPYAPPTKPRARLAAAPTDAQAGGTAAAGGGGRGGRRGPAGRRGAPTENLEANDEPVPDQPAEGGEEDADGAGGCRGGLRRRRAGGCR